MVRAFKRLLRSGGVERLNWRIFLTRHYLS
jgi:hypothetical protein